MRRVPQATLSAAVLCAATLLLAAPRSATGEVVISSSQVRDLLPAGMTGTIVYVRKSDKKAYFVDFAESGFRERPLCDKSGVGSPLISPEGKLVTFHVSDVANKYQCDGRNTAEIFVCNLKENSSYTNVCSGFDPHWWINDGKTYLVYKTEYCKSSWPNHPGKTMKQRIDPVTFAAIGEATEVFGQGLNGGLSKSGRWLCHAYRTVDMVDLNSNDHYQVNGGGQGCNASISPATDPAKENRMMHLELPHSTFAIRDNSDNRVWHITKPSGAEEWQNPEWSTHDNYCTATAKHGDGYNVYVIRISDKELYKVIDGNNAVPHLWVGEPSAGTPQANTPSIAPNGGEVTGPSVRVTLATSTEGASIHYTTDGSVPTESSAPYTQPFDLNVPSGASVTLKAKAFKTGMDPSEAASATFTRVSYRSPDNPAIDLTAGVEYAYYEGSWDMLPSFTDLTPLVRGTAAGFDLGLTQRNDHFAVRYTGYIDISAEGTYTFSSTSDDGSAVYIGSRMVVDNDGTHAAEEQSGTIALGAGKHEIVVAFFEAEGGEELTVRYQGPGITRQPIPESALYRRVPPVTVTAPNGNETFTVGSTAHITWETDSRVADVAIKISPDGGKSWADITSDGSVDKGSDEWKNFSWTVPGRLDGMSLVSDNCLISIEEYNVPANNDRSDAQFAIVPASAAHPRGVGRRNHRVLVRWDGGAVAVPRSSEILLFSLDGTVRTRLRLGGRPGARLPHELPAGAYLLVQAASADRAVAPRRILLIR